MVVGFYVFWPLAFNTGDEDSAAYLLFCMDLGTGSTYPTNRRRPSFGSVSLYKHCTEMLDFGWIEELQPVHAIDAHGSLVIKKPVADLSEADLLSSVQ